MHRYLMRELKVDLVLCCPHHPDANCDCRKPKTGLVRDIESLLDKKKCWMVGDKPDDVTFGKNLGVRTIKIPEQAKTLKEATKMILRRTK